MTHPWQPERVVDPDEARTLIEGQLDLKIASIEPLGQGWDNTAYLVNGAWVFRFPRRQVAVPLIETEGRVLGDLAPRLPLPIPVPRWFGEPTDGYAWPFIGSEYVPGITACRAALTDAERIALAPTLGEFLAALHGTPPPDGLPHGSAPQYAGKLDPRRVRERAADTWQSLAALGLAARRPVIEALFAACEELPPSLPRAVVHGDFYVRHLVVRVRTESPRELAGVIDWGDVHLGDPALDLSIAHSLPACAHGTFLRHYGDVPEATWMRARMRAAFYGLALSRYAADTGDVRLAAEARFTLERLGDP